MKLDFESAKIRVTQLIDDWSEEVITDLLNDLKSLADQRNIRDIEFTLDTIKETQKLTFEIKQKILKSNTTQQIFSILNCDIFEDVEEDILCKYLDIEIKIKK